MARAHAVRLLAAWCLLSLTGASAALRAAPPDSQWPRFRGPNGRGESEATGIPHQWSNSDYLWKVPLPGIGHSSPTVWGDRLFVQSGLPDDGTHIVLCIDTATGKTLWEHRYPGITYPMHLRNSYGSSTPAVDAERVYVTWGTPEQAVLLALDHDGNELWRKDLGKFYSNHGWGTSPAAYEGRVLLAYQQRETVDKAGAREWTSAVLCVDGATGETIWKTPRLSDVACYSVPFLREASDGSREVVCASQAHGIYALDWTTGKEKWSVDDAFTMRTVSSPLEVGSIIFGSTGSGGGGNYVAAVRTGPRPALAYKLTRQAPYVPCPVAYGDLVFFWSDQGIVTCIEAESGQQVWQHRLRDGGTFSGSPVRVRNVIYAIADNGDVVAIAASRTFQELGRMPLGEDSRSTPAVVGQRMFLRTYSHLFCVGQRGESPESSTGARQASSPATNIVPARLSDGAEVRP